MIDFTKPVQTRDGRKVRVLCTDGGGDFPVVGPMDNGSLCRWKASGAYRGDERLHEFDLTLGDEPKIERVKS